MDKFWVGLSSIEKLDSKFILALYNHFNNIEKAFYATKKELEDIDGLNIKKFINYY